MLNRLLAWVRIAQLPDYLKIQALVLRELREGPGSISQFVESHLSRFDSPAVSRMIENCIKDGLVEERGTGKVKALYLTPKGEEKLASYGI